ncbi:MAG: transporter [Acidobacteria bacterium]|nr:transporter [Acidobacteriota bacterium]
MRKKVFAAGVWTLVLLCVPGYAQTPEGSGGKLALIIPNLYGPGGLTLPNLTHFAHFDSAFQANFLPFNTALASQLSSLPLPSPASGFTYTLDKSLGTYSRSAQSFGPILAERAETLGKDKFYFGFSYQRFRFDTIDGLDLHQVPVVFGHLIVPNPSNPEALKDIITSSNGVDIHVGQFTTFFTYGLADRVDVSVAIPFVSASLAATADATIQRIGTANDLTIHAFPNAPGDGSKKKFAGSGTASGIGDVLVRLKANVAKSESAGFALGIDLRAPTGDEYNFLGSGSVGVKPFAALSFRSGRVAPHFNAAYQWNGKTVLAGDVLSGRKDSLPNQFFWVGGVDIGVTKFFTIAGDVLGQHVQDAQRVVRSSYTAVNNVVYPQISFKKGSLQETNGALGFKVNAKGNLLVSFNVLFKLNDDGLRGRVTPLIGLSYTF